MRVVYMWECVCITTTGTHHRAHNSKQNKPAPPLSTTNPKHKHSGSHHGGQARAGGGEGPLRVQGHKDQHGGGPAVHAADGGGLPPHVRHGGLCVRRGVCVSGAVERRAKSHITHPFFTLITGKRPTSRWSAPWAASSRARSRSRCIKNTSVSLILCLLGLGGYGGCCLFKRTHTPVGQSPSADPFHHTFFPKQRAKQKNKKIKQGKQDPVAVVGRGYHTMLSRAVKEKVRTCARALSI